MNKLKLGVSYFGIRNPQHVKKDLEYMKEIGCNTILHTFSENDYHFYPDTMKKIVHISKELGFETYIDPWGVGGVFGGEAFTHFVLRHTEARQRFPNDNLAPAACPNSKHFREFMYQWIEQALKTGVDYVFWDEPHFFKPEWDDMFDTWACRCSTCQEKFREEYGTEMPKTVTKKVKQFKEESLHNFLTDMFEQVKERGGKNALCLLPDWDAEASLQKQWAPYAKLDTLDIFGTDPYFLLFDQNISAFRSHANVLKKISDEYGVEPQIWIQGFRVKKGEENYIGLAIEEAFNHGINNIMTWSFKASSYMSHIQCERPKRVWNEVVTHYKKLRRKRETQ